MFQTDSQPQHKTISSSQTQFPPTWYNSNGVFNPDIVGWLPCSQSLPSKSRCPGEDGAAVLPGRGWHNTHDGEYLTLHSPHGESALEEPPYACLSSQGKSSTVQPRGPRGVGEHSQAHRSSRDDFKQKLKVGSEDHNLHSPRVPSVRIISICPPTGSKVWILSVTSVI